MRSLLILLLLTPAFCLNAQVTETFADGDFTSNPAWSGTITTFTINTAQELQTSNTVAASSYLTTPHGFATLDGKEWRIRVKITTTPSASNYARVFLTADDANLYAAANGFFLQFGESGSADAVHLGKLAGGVETTICSGPASQVAASFNISVRVIRDAAGLWSLYTDAAGGSNFTLASTGTDATNLTGTHFGVSATYTASNATKYYFDDIYAGPEIVDSEAPSLVSVTPIFAQQVDVLFSEPVTGSAVTAVANYSLNPAVTVSGAATDGSNSALIHLSLAAPMSNGQDYTLTIASAEDQAGNTATDLSGDFSYLVNEAPAEGDILISEFICDPSPVIGLPELEFVEIHNVGSKYFNLTGWKLGDASSDGTVTSGWISPGEYKILCAAASQASFPGSYAVTSFPSLNNSADEIVLKDPSLNKIDKISFTDDWYRDEVKAEGGYSIELINPNDPCSDASNWIASNSPTGGTPGLQNSVYNVTPDTEAPALAGVFAIDPGMLQLTFSEGMDSSALVNASFATDPPLTVSSVTAADTFVNTVQVLFSSPISASQTYAFTYGPVSDCWLNTTTLSGSFALPETALPGDLVINEILYDPGTGGSDFIEICNKSQKVINLSSMAIASLDDGIIADQQFITENRLLFPNDYVVLTPDSNFQLSQFPQAVNGKFLQIPLPSYNNDSSSVVFLGSLGEVLDKVSYTEDWHLSLIDDTENKTLERIDPNGVSNSPSNWHTAAESIGFGTPGRQNSQYQAGGANGDFGTMETIFSPDNDGFQDVLLFYYAMPQGEMIATVKIYDDYGRLVKILKKSELLSPSGNFSWDGINDDQQKTNIGVYLAVIEAFSTDGKANFSKRIAFTVAGKLD